MKAAEFAKLAMAIRTYYPKENILPTPESMELWYRELEDIPYELAEIVVREWVHTNKWSPTISDIRERAAVLKLGEMEEWSDGWKRVQLAIRRYGSYRELEALESLDEVTRATVERLGYRQLCLSEEPELDRANFRKIYGSIAERRRKDAALPLQLKQLAAKFRLQLKNNQEQKQLEANRKEI